MFHHWVVGSTDCPKGRLPKGGFSGLGVLTSFLHVLFQMYLLELKHLVSPERMGSEILLLAVQGLPLALIFDFNFLPFTFSASVPFLGCLSFVSACNGCSVELPRMHSSAHARLSPLSPCNCTASQMMILMACFIEYSPALW